MQTDVTITSEENQTSEISIDVCDLLEAVFLQACYYSLGAALVVEAKVEFDTYIKKLSGLIMMEDCLENPASTSTCFKQFSLEKKILKYHNL